MFAVCCLFLTDEIFRFELYSLPVATFYVCYRNVLMWMKLRIHDELTPRNRVLPENPSVPQLVDKSPAFYVTPKVTAFTTAHHVFIS
jgi:hypothetical protein